MSKLWLVPFLLLSACSQPQSIQSKLDRWGFEHLGGTFFLQPFQVTSKQLLFDAGELFGRSVILSGKAHQHQSAIAYW